MDGRSRPNILYVFTDQQQAGMMGCAGNPYVRTPAMDSIAANGVRFERAYCANPVCLPSRYSMMTGRMPGDVGIRSNPDGNRASISAQVKSTTMGWLLRGAGYDTAYGGKVHLPPGMSPEEMGFTYLTADQRDGLADASADFIRRERDRPFLLVSSFINPHDICFMAIGDAGGDEVYGVNLDPERRVAELSALGEALKLPVGVSEQEFLDRICPPAPSNLEPQDPEPEAVGMIVDQRPFKRHARQSWSTERWRLHRWAYCHLTEMVDAQIGRVLEALRETGQEEDTVVIFSTDHGDMDGSHRMEHKTVLYEEAARVPLIVSWKGVAHAGQVDRDHLVSNGLDLLPTICDYAGVVPPDDLEGVSLRPLVEGTPPGDWRERLHVESEFGHMVAGGRYKYVLYDEGRDREQLIDLDSDPGEMSCVTDAPELRPVLEGHRDWLQTRLARR